MKTFRARTGPFAEQPFFELREIETICTEALQATNLYPAEPAPIRIDRFIEKRFGVQPSYEDLPVGILGFTRFGSHGVEQVVVAQALDAEGTLAAERRLRTTLAHEAGHGLLHAHLFALQQSPKALFGDGLSPDAPKLLCRDGGVAGVGPEKKPPYRWWEFQANQAMGALLLPRDLLEKAISPMMSAQGSLGLQSLPDANRSRAMRLLSDTFHVNPIVVQIRLEALYPPGGQPHL